MLDGQLERLVENPSLVVKTQRGSMLVEPSLWYPLQRQAEQMLTNCKGLRAKLKTRR